MGKTDNAAVPKIQDLKPLSDSARGVGVIVAWEHVRLEQVQLQQNLQATQQAIPAANTREDARRTELQDQLKMIETCRSLTPVSRAVCPSFASVPRKIPGRTLP